MAGNGTPRVYGFAYDRDALAFLQGMPKKQRRQVIKKIQALASNPTPDGVKMLKGMRDGEDRVFRERSGDYRILYVVRDSTIVVLDIRDRKDGYDG